MSRQHNTTLAAQSQGNSNQIKSELLA